MANDAAAPPGLLWDAVLASEVALVALDADAIIREWSSGAAQLFGWSRAEALGHRWNEFGPLADPVRRRQAERMVRAALAGESWSGEWTGRDRAGGAVSLRTVAQPVRSASGDVDGVLLVSLDVSARDAFQDALLKQAMHDPLTGLPTRALVLEQLAGASAANAVAGAAVLFIDLDDFKDVNDTFGHGAGDEVLVEVARRLRASVRDGDVVGRIGGDEFVVLCRSADPARGAAAAAERIGRQLAAPVRTAVGSVTVTASVGGVVVTPDTDATALLHLADSAMYRAKTDGHGRFHLASPTSAEL